MRWPWVSRAHHEAVERQLNRIIVDAQREAQQWQLASAQWRAQFESMVGHYEKVLDRYHELRMAGANPALLPKVEPKEADPMVLLINARTAGRPALRALALQQLRRDRLAGKDEAEIQREIEAGQPLDGVPA